MQLSTDNHDRDRAGLTYVYPVLSRRSGGLSLGINVNTNNACNWRCIYCQVPDLRRGGAPPVDLEKLRTELLSMLDDIADGSFYARFQVPDRFRQLKDIAISGNGEPTSVRNFTGLVELVGGIAQQSGAPLVLISNGSLVHQAAVQQGLGVLGGYGGQLWFKLDSATVQGQRLINHAAQSPAKHRGNLVAAARLCPTWIQTCLFGIGGRGLLAGEREAYVQLLRDIRNEAPLMGVMLYTLARPSLQPEAPQLAALPETELFDFAEEIRALGYDVRVNV